MSQIGACARAADAGKSFSDKPPAIKKPRRIAEINRIEHDMHGSSKADGAYATRAECEQADEARA
jgi:hypothetical protein